MLTQIPFHFPAAPMAGTHPGQLVRPDCDTQPGLSGPSAEASARLPEPRHPQRPAAAVCPQHPPSGPPIATNLRQGHQLGPAGGHFGPLYRPVQRKGHPACHPPGKCACLYAI